MLILFLLIFLTSFKMPPKIRKPSDHNLTPLHRDDSSRDCKPSFDSNSALSDCSSNIPITSENLQRILSANSQSFLRAQQSSMQAFIATLPNLLTTIGAHESDYSLPASTLTSKKINVWEVQFQ